jgi:hypothetical protein
MAQKLVGDSLVVGGHGVNGIITVNGQDNHHLIQLHGGDAESSIRLGGENRPGSLAMCISDGKPAAALTAADATLRLGGEGVKGRILILDGSDPLPSVELLSEPHESRINLGGHRRPGSIMMLDEKAALTVQLMGKSASLTLGSAIDPLVLLDGLEAKLTLGSKAQGHTIILDGSTGIISVNDPSTRSCGTSLASSTLDLGGPAEEGHIRVCDTNNNALINLYSETPHSVVDVGNQDRPGKIRIYSGNLDAITHNVMEAITLDGATGDIMIANADIAEEFDLAVEKVEPGTVMVLNEEGRVAPSSSAYDTRVVGVVSGAGSQRTGLVLDKRATGAKRTRVALMGKVFCLVDATRMPVRVGDLLTSGEKEGHAMRAVDAKRAFGAVLGKALAPLKSKCALTLILVTLQ